MPEGGGPLVHLGRGQAQGDAPASRPAVTFPPPCATEGTGMDETPCRVPAAHPAFFTTKGVGKGTASACRVHGLAEQSGGTLEIESEPATARRCRVWLRVATINEEGARTFQRAGARAGSETQSLHILAVDADFWSCSTRRRCLRSWAMSSIRPVPRAEALHILSPPTHPVDLMVTHGPQTKRPALRPGARDLPDLPIPRQRLCRVRPATTPSRRVSASPSPRSSWRGRWPTP